MSAPGFDATFEKFTLDLMDRMGSHGIISARLRDAMLYSVLGPGKRLRPRLLLAAAERVGVAPAAALPAACALEYYHCATLIHDDLPCLDNDDFRRGRPANHKQFDEATALLAGDSLIILAPQALLECAPHVAPAALAQALSLLLEVMGAAGVMSGQALELELTARPGTPFEREGAISRMHALKTGVLFEAALAIPAALAGRAPDEIARLRGAGREIGLAFQIIDDLQDAEQDRAAGDEAFGRNVLSRLSPDEAKARARAALDRAREIVGPLAVLEEIRAAVPA